MKIEEFEAKAAAEFPGVELEFQDGVQIHLRSMLDLDERAEQLLEAARKQYAALNAESASISEMRLVIVELLAATATEYELATERLTPLRLSVLRGILAEVQEQQTEAAKSSEGSD